MNTKPLEKNKLIKKYTIFSLITFIVVITLMNTIIIHDDEVAIITRLGKSHKVVKNPGIYMLIPFIDSSNTISRKVTETLVDPVQITTSDRRELFVEAYAIWQLSDPVIFIYTNGGKQPSTLVGDYLSSAIPSAASDYSYENIKSPLEGSMSLEDTLKKEVGDKAYQNGIVIKDIFIKSIYLSTKSEQTVIERMKTDCEKIAASILEEGQDESSKIKQDGDREAALITKKAELEVSTTRAEADTEAAKIYAESYGKDVEFYRFIRTLELYRSNLKDKTTIVFPADSPFAKYLIK